LQVGAEVRKQHIEVAARTELATEPAELLAQRCQPFAVKQPG
jgi:hypothetical protein